MVTEPAESAAPEPVRFDDALRARITDRLVAHDRLELPLDGRRHAAVAIVLCDSDLGSDAADPYQPPGDAMDAIPGGAGDLDGRMVDVAGGAAFVLCRRSARLNAHASQWALPGGRLDDGESVLDAARRETAEEVGLDLGADAVLGLLDDYPTRSGYVMTPVVIWADGAAALVPNPGEVRAAYRVGLHQLSRSDSPRFVSIPESDRPVVQIPLGRDLIHAPTGAVLLGFRRVCLDGRRGVDARVDHLEQPVFAWG